MARFGIRLISDVGSPGEILDMAVLADRLGYDSIVFPSSPFRFNPSALVAAAVPLTKRAEISIGGSLYYSTPAEIATFVATLDDLSGGRVSLRLGLHNFENVRWIGLDPSDWPQRLREGITLIRTLLRGEVARFDGAVYHWTDQAYLRVPPRRADVPIVISPIGDDFLELAGELGDGATPMVAPVEASPLILGPIERGLARSANPGRSFDRCAFVWIAVSDDREEARALLADIVAYYGYFTDPRALATIGFTPDDFKPAYDLATSNDMTAARRALRPDMLRLGIAGTPDDCARGIEEVLRAGFDHVSLGGPLGPDPAVAMRVIAERVLPALR